MKKVAFVVEGQTEQIFVLEFINKLVTVLSCQIILKKYHCGDVTTVTTRGAGEEDATHCIWIINVENDEKTLSFIEENVEIFKRRGFQCIFGLRDRYSGDKHKAPVNPDAIDGRTNLLTSSHGLDIELTVAVEEIEAWFLSVPSFFQKYHETLTVDRVSAILGIDLSTVAIDTIPHPANLIDRVLRTVGLAYKKRLDDSYKVAAALDYETLYLDRATKIRPLGRFVGHLTRALA